ncbi:gephyrin-like molybdotransferase Glp [Jeongeupia sp. USM3]|uniref:molybdopterin molybdotransferase MoeA n=1 Tax=Jeongeupia sp. USM3 TaxID=1906741 RepID=UPI00089E01AF|nr:gephyrin-like molybdotransferase Glp [Jeongeupia sp. USM3]AOY01266.1 molybdopterin molybdenumtransferase MoeA [Jeongeupia sp. USM3]
MLTVDQALAQLLGGARRITDTETLPLGAALGRTLAADVVSTLAVPGFDNSAMDGYALNVADFGPGATFSVVQRIAAGDTGDALAPGEAARIFTGAPVPDGTNAVAMQEDCAVEGGILSIGTPLRTGQHIRRRGEDVMAGAAVIKAGTRLGAAELGLLAAVGVARVGVMRQLRVALLSTGNELVEPGAPLAPGKIYNSNRYAISALLTDAGCIVDDLGIVPDQFAATRDILADAAATHDVVLSTGGVSVGEEDHVKAAVESLGALSLWKIAIKPGKPFAFGRIPAGEVRAGSGGETGSDPGADFIGLPGNPVSSYITFLLFVRPFLAARVGGEAPVQAVRVPAGFAIGRAGNRREYLRARLENGRAVLYPNQGSGVLTSVVWADGLVVIPEGATVADGDAVDFVPLAALR